MTIANKDAETMERKSLVVLLHGFQSSPRRLARVAERVAKTLPNAEVWVPQLPTSRLSIVKPADLVRRIADEIQQRFGRFHCDDVVLVGHSFGALLARAVYLFACGSLSDSEAGIQDAQVQPWAQDAQVQPWAAHVQRIVLFAALSRGWSISDATPRARAMLWSFGAWIGAWYERFTKSRVLTLSARRGATFVTDLRVRWIRFRRACCGRQALGSALTIQLLGTIDDVVSPDDNVDLFAGSEFFYLDVPSSGHRSILHMDDTPPGRERSRLFDLALAGTRDDVAREAVMLTRDLGNVTDAAVTDVVFVLHGIRDYGFWTSRVARRVEQTARANGEPRVIATETASYGYFGMGPFLLPGERREKVEWFMDRYVDTVARYPSAKRFHFIGHSHGTYIAAAALRTYPCLRLNRVVFAGSVVPRRFEWQRFIERGQCDEVLNLVASADWVVAWFPGLFDSVRRIPVLAWLLGRQDIGGAGHSGFDAADKMREVRNVQWVRGGHSAALGEQWWDAIARFVLEEGYPSQNATKQAWLVRLVGRFPMLAWCCAIIVVAGGFGALIVLKNFECLSPVLLGAAIVVYVLLIRYVLVRL